MLGLPGGFARNFNMWGGVGWGGVGWGVSTLVFMSTHGTLLVCHLCTWYAAGVSCANVSRNRSVMFDCPPIRNTMHEVKLHQTAFMANCVKWKRCKLQVIVDFSARFGEKKSSLDIVKTFNDQLHLKTWYEVFLWTTTFYMKKHSQINTMTTRTTNGCSWHVVPVDLVPSWATSPRRSQHVATPQNWAITWYSLL